MLWTLVGDSSSDINKKVIKNEQLSVDNKNMRTRALPYAGRFTRVACIAIAVVNAIFLYHRSGVSLQTLFAILGGVFLFSSHRGLLSLSVLSFLFLALQGGVSFLANDLSLVFVGLPLLVLGLLFAFLILTPENSRSGLLGNGYRAHFKSAVHVKFNDITLKTIGVNLSLTGVKVRWESHFPAMTVGQKVHLEIPELEEFSSEGRLVVWDSDAKWAAFKFLGWNFSSVEQHLKLRSHIHHLSKSKAGYTLIEMLLAMGIGAVVLVGLNQSMIQMVKSQSEVKRRYWIEMLKTEIINAIRSPNAWANTIQSLQNGSMSCLRDRSSCDPAINAGLIEVKDVDDNTIINSVDPSVGFSSDGQPCSTFDPVNGDDSCPLRFNIAWSPVCAGLCVNPEIKISINLEFKPKTQQGIINLNRESFTFYRNPLADSLEITCASLGGVFDSTMGACQWTRVASTCSQSGQLFVGFDSNGNEICEPLQAQTCPDGTWMMGVDLNGALICQAG